MAPLRRLAPLLCLVLLPSACSKVGEQPAAQPAVAGTTTSTTTTSSAALPPLSPEATAYVADCHHRFEKQQDETEQAMTECTFHEFDQNCSPDPSGCWERGQACLEACGGPCTSCDDQCAGGCDDCRGKCVDGDEACVHACANERVGCRDACLAAKDKCADVDCPAAEAKCDADFEAKRAQLCPRCSELQSCFDDAMSSEKDPREVCRRKFKREREECFDWCFEF